MPQNPRPTYNIKIKHVSNLTSETAIYIQFRAHKIINYNDYSAKVYYLQSQNNINYIKLQNQKYQMPTKIFRS